MELRYYWRVLVRRRTVILYTFVLVAVLSLAMVGYSYYGTRYKGTAQIGLHVRADYRVRNPVYDPAQAANVNTTVAIQEITKYAATTQYFKLVSAELKSGKPSLTKDWKSLQQSAKIYPLPDSQDIYVEWSGPNQATADRVETAIVDQIIAYIPQYSALAQTPPIDYKRVQQPDAERIGLSKPLTDFLLRAALGLVAGIILAYLFEYLDNTVQDEADVERWMGLPTLAVIPGKAGGRQVRRARSASA